MKTTTIKIETPYGEATLSKQGTRYGFTFEKLTIEGTTTEAAGTIVLGPTSAQLLLVCHRNLASVRQGPTEKEAKILGETVISWLRDFRREWLA